MEKRVAKIEADQATLSTLLIRIADSLLALAGFQQEVRDRFDKIDDRFTRIDDEAAEIRSKIGRIESKLDDLIQVEAERHKETIGFLSKHNK